MKGRKGRMKPGFQLLLVSAVLFAAEMRPACAAQSEKDLIAGQLRVAAEEVGGSLKDRYEKVLIPFFESRCEVGNLMTPEGSRLSMMVTTSPGSRESVVILVGKGNSWVEDLELIYDQDQHQRKVFIFDQEGQGLSSRSTKNEGVTDIKNFGAYSGDMNEFMDRVVKPQAVGPLHMITHSTGGTIGQSYLLEHPGVFKDAVHIAPLFEIKFPDHMNESEAKIIAIFDEWKDGPDFPVEKKSVEPPDLQGERRKFRWALNRAFSAEGGVIGSASARWVSSLIDETRILRKRASDVTTPFLVIEAGQDHTVDNEAEEEVVLHSRPGIAHIERFANLQHAFLYQDENALKEVLNSINRFLGEAQHSSSATLPQKESGCLLSRMRRWFGIN